jgi:hypothetical protein
MKIDFDTPLHNESGEKISLGKGDEAKPATLAWVACQALLSTFPNESIDGEEKHRRFKLWQRLKDGGEIEVKAEEIVLLKRLIGMGATPLICGQAWDILEA